MNSNNGRDSSNIIPSFVVENNKNREQVRNEIHNEISHNDTNKK